MKFWKTNDSLELIQFFDCGLLRWLVSIVVNTMGAENGNSPIFGGAILLEKVPEICWFWAKIVWHSKSFHYNNKPGRIYMLLWGLVLGNECIVFSFTSKFHPPTLFWKIKTILIKLISNQDGLPVLCTLTFLLKNRCVGQIKTNHGITLYAFFLLCCED